MSEHKILEQRVQALRQGLQAIADKSDNGTSWVQYAVRDIIAADGPNTTAPSVVYVDLPQTLPSLAIAVFRLPVPMTLEDYEKLLETLNMWKPALIAKEPTP